MPIEPYQEKAVCPKCGCLEVKTKWCPYPHSKNGMHRVLSARGQIVPEHLDRICTRCGYCWVQGTIDTEPELLATMDVS
jgi:hypothetical protein